MLVQKATSIRGCIHPKQNPVVYWGCKIDFHYPFLNAWADNIWCDASELRVAKPSWLSIFMWYQETVSPVAIHGLALCHACALTLRHFICNTRKALDVGIIKRVWQSVSIATGYAYPKAAKYLACYQEWLISKYGTWKLMGISMWNNQ